MTTETVVIGCFGCGGEELPEATCTIFYAKADGSIAPPLAVPVLHEEDVSGPRLGAADPRPHAPGGPRGVRRLLAVPGNVSSRANRHQEGRPALHRPDRGPYRRNRPEPSHSGLPAHGPYQKPQQASGDTDENDALGTSPRIRRRSGIALPRLGVLATRRGKGDPPSPP